ncbi:chitin synthase chs-2-like [Agrilus planipennis]|uniref:chitin synthase n=1 Tax=Agrilus planipennis TaxID=224129 RepID=A0A7F5REM8_AGRPL|nr:chitin synthase chs-2-like [Agrilus planipennis]XP_025834428.1 chitin synthase chs-2-like [Agrilus planipennis]
MRKRTPTNDDDEEEQEPLCDNTRTEQEIKPWDVFKDPPPKNLSSSMEENRTIENSIVALKIATCIVTFACVLGGAVISKGTLLFMTSQIKPNQSRIYCNKDLDVSGQFMATISDTERVAWIWLIMCVFFVPEVETFLRSLRVCIFKSWRMPTKKDVSIIFISETLPTIGTAIFLFCILPEIDVVKGAMLTNVVCVIPGIVGFLSSQSRKNKMKILFILDIASVLAQVSALVIWPLISDNKTLWLIPVSLVLISCGWWENFVSEDSPVPFIKTYAQNTKEFKNDKYFAYIFVSAWKCLLFFCTVIIIIYIQERRIAFLFTEFTTAFSDHYININQIRPIIGDTSDLSLAEIIATGGRARVSADYMAPVWVFVINVLGSYVCYIFGKFACKIMVQTYCYAFPINLTVPTLITALVAFCGVYSIDECAFKNAIPQYLAFNGPPLYFVRNFIENEFAWLWLIWLLSQTWISFHIWNPRVERLARTEKLFAKPMYDGVFVDQSLALNRKRNYKSIIEEEKDWSDSYSENSASTEDYSEASSSPPIQEDETTRIYACATMWHETTEEMMEFLKSIFRLDEDQCAKRLAKNYLEFDIPDYFEIETHIFFDDAFVRVSVDDNDPSVNEWVDKLVKAVDKAASEVHEIHMRIRAPKKYVTPYGGRLEWTLPGKTKMIAHLKDRAKIRPKKRWSQVMYMYYLLGHRLMERKDLSPKRKDIIAENTYILALDGDIDFQPHAVHLLVDLMKKNKTLGAACGRIHPIGSGVMVWYQKFEYAVGHWLQKAAEHMFGCVLCSPGCFSLFRAKALMDDSVMRKYTMRSQEAKHFVQYDQGEDRWLCTLLLQRGYRVEYSAASDAYTHAPEGFNEFFNQRRRWMPSTCANIMDLIQDSKKTIAVNDNISRGYIFYHIVLMVGTVLGPGTLMLMVIGALVTVFSFDQYTSLKWNVTPLIIFMISCYYCKANIQLIMAAIISGVYALVMMAVLVGVTLQIFEDGWLAPSNLFLMLVAGEFIIAAILHPKEFGCLPHGLIYFITIPCMYLILVIYSVFNLNNISWGTREVTVVPKAAADAEEEKDQKKDEKKEPTNLKAMQNRIFALFGKGDDNAGSFEFSCGGLFKILLCAYRKESPEQVELALLNNNIKKMESKLEGIEKLILLEPDERQPTQQNRSSSITSRRRTTIMEGLKGELSKVIENAEDQYSLISESQISEKTISEPNSWMYEENLGRGEFGCISTKEKNFWEGLIDKYLHPIEDDKEKVAKDLKDLRDKTVMMFLMVNALFVVAIFLLTLNKDLIHIDWPFGIKYSFRYVDVTGDIQLTRTFLQLEPIGLVFVVFFGCLMGLQFVGMLLHRFSTFCQILSSTPVPICSFRGSKAELTDEELLEKDPVRMVKRLIKLRGVDDDDDDKEDRDVEKRKTIIGLAKDGAKPDEATTTDLTRAFNRRLTKFRNYEGNDATGRKSIAFAIDKRRSTVANLGRPSVSSIKVRARQSHVNFGYEPEGETNT